MKNKMNIIIFYLSSYDVPSNWFSFIFILFVELFSTFCNFSFVFDDTSLFCLLIDTVCWRLVVVDDGDIVDILYK